MIELNPTYVVAKFELARLDSDKDCNKSVKRLIFIRNEWYAATSTILISAIFISAHLERAAHHREFSVARRSLPQNFRSALLYIYKIILKSVRSFKTRLLLDFRLQSLECALMRNGLLRMRANEKPPTENTRSSLALLRYVLLIRC